MKLTLDSVRELLRAYRCDERLVILFHRELSKKDHDGWQIALMARIQEGAHPHRAMADVLEIFKGEKTP